MSSPLRGVRPPRLAAPSVLFARTANTAVRLPTSIDKVRGAQTLIGPSALEAVALSLIVVLALITPAAVVYLHV